MKVIDLETIKSIELNVLAEIHNFCIQNNINYSLGFGTLIGAVRHKGFIPWDDDIDIVMLRTDYDKLISMFPEHYGNISLASIERDKKWNRAYAVAYDNRTVKIEEIDANVDNIGIGIDIFPIDQVSDNKFKWCVFNYIRIILLNMYLMKTIKNNSKRNIWKKSILLVSKFILLPLKTRQLACLISNWAQIWKYSKTSFCFENVEDLFSKERLDKYIFESYTELVFEKKFFKVMAGYDDFLRNTYGDYMVLPPVEKQVSHHSYMAFFK